MSNNFWLTTTATARPGTVAPIFGGAFGHVCPNGLGMSAVRPYATDGIAAARKVQGPQSWSPPGT